VGLIGSGRIGGTVARFAVAAGHQVLLSNSRRHRGAWSSKPRF